MTTPTTPVTIASLQTFIDAAEFIADDENWVPSAKQWKRIRQMISDLEVYHPPQPLRNPHEAFAPVTSSTTAPVDWGLPIDNRIDVPVGSMVVQPSPSTLTSVVPGTAPPSMIPAATSFNPTPTPPSDGQYRSGFA